MKKNNLTLKAALCLLLVFGTAQNAVSQVTIGSGIEPHPAALLDLNQGLSSLGVENLSEGGLLLPRVRLISLTSFEPLGTNENSIAGMMVYNITQAVDENLSPGIHYFDGARWRRMITSGTSNWFFMPSIALDMSPGIHEDVNLFEKFQKQFWPRTTTGSGRLIGSENALASAFPEMMTQRMATDFWFFITVSDDDPPVWGDITIDDDGNLEYQIIGVPTDETFMNIIFVERD